MTQQNWVVEPWFPLKSTTNIQFFIPRDHFELMTKEPEFNCNEQDDSTWGDYQFLKWNHCIVGIPLHHK